MQHRRSRAKRPTLHALLLLPSAYGLVTWMASLLLSQMGIVPATPISTIGWAVMAFVPALFLFSILLQLPSAKAAVERSEKPAFTGMDYVLFAVCAAIGSYGLYAYISEASIGLGSITYFFDDLFASTLSIRKVSHDVESIGFQLSYFSWVSIFLGAYVILKTPANPAVKLVIGTIILAEFLLNLSFVARSRPIWIFLTCGLAIYFATNVSKVRLRPLLIVAVATPIAIFVGFAVFTGKYDASRGVISSLVEYVISGPLYLDAVLNSWTWPDYIPYRTFYPISKVMELLGVLREVPDPILQFRYVPFRTNVGTFLEPLYMDGGYPFLIFGAIIMILGIDKLALFSFNSGLVMGRYVWANMIFAQLLCFFAPRYNTVAIYLFVAIFAAMYVLVQRAPKPKRVRRRPALVRV